MRAPLLSCEEAVGAVMRTSFLAFGFNGFPPSQARSAQWLDGNRTPITVARPPRILTWFLFPHHRNIRLSGRKAQLTINCYQSIFMLSRCINTVKAEKTAREKPARIPQFQKFLPARGCSAPALFFRFLPLPNRAIVPEGTVLPAVSEDGTVTGGDRVWCQGSVPGDGSSFTFCHILVRNGYGAYGFVHL